jgi:hypothetical protein
VDLETAATATHCHTLQHTAIHCNTLQHTATHRVSMQDVKKAAVVENEKKIKG